MDSNLDSLNQRCRGIRERLAELSRPSVRQRILSLMRPGPPKVFGAEVHRFRLNAPLLEHELKEWERKHRVDLPAEYRAFLIHAGNGGAGPYYGLLGPMNDCTLFADFEERDRFLGAECILHDDIDCTSDDWLISVAGADWEERWDRDEMHPYQGTLPLCEVGCCYYYVLLLSGTNRGRVCGVNRQFEPPLFPRQKSFLDWYEAWLDAVCFDNDELFEKGTVFRSRQW